jgi:hypothetical protein
MAHFTTQINRRAPLADARKKTLSQRTPKKTCRHTQRPLLLAALGACAGLLALSAAFPRPIALDDAASEREREQQQQLADALDREARAVTSGALWGLKEQQQQEPSSGRSGADDEEKQQ